MNITVDFVLTIGIDGQNINITNTITNSTKRYQQQQQHFISHLQQCFPELAKNLTETFQNGGAGGAGKIKGKMGSTWVMREP